MLQEMLSKTSGKVNQVSYWGRPLDAKNQTLTLLVTGSLYLGKLMEVSPAEELYDKPIHPYTSALLSAIPIPDPHENQARTRTMVTGEPPNPITPPPGCRFHTRCPRASEICRTVEPQLTEYAGGHLAACHHPQHVNAQEVASATRSPASPLSSGEEHPQAESAV